MQNSLQRNLDHPICGPQRTLAKRAAVSGFGFWTGNDVLLELLPAPENFGIRFLRTGNSDAAAIPALLENRLINLHQTSLGNDSFRFDMVEHLLSALNGLRISNCLIRIDGQEIPGKDGSALSFVQAIRKAGIVEQSLPKPVRILRKPVTLDGDWGKIEAFPSETGEISFSYEMDYSGREFPPQLAKQSFEVRLTPGSDADASKEYEEKIAGARTFLTYGEAQELLRYGLCSRVSPQDVLVFKESGPVENQLRFPNECARHKVLDMIGDFSLGGAQIIACFHAYRSGHRQNAELLAEILRVTEIE